MNITCSQKDLAKGIATVQRAVAPRATPPILGNILLEAKEGHLRLAATNLDISTNCWILADVAEEGAITVPARLFSEMVNKLPPGRVTLSLDIKTLSMNLVSGNFQAKIKGLDAYDFPQTLSESTDSIALNAQLLDDMIDQVAFVASHDESRANLTCVQFRTGPRLAMAATDGFRLGMRSHPLGSATPALEVLIPATSMTELGRILADSDPDKPVVVSTDSVKGIIRTNRIAFRIEGKDSYVRAELSAQLVDSKYPDYQAIIPKSSTTTITMGSDAFLRSLQTARLFARDDANVVSLTANPGDCLKVSATGDMGRSDDALNAEIKGTAITIMVNVGYLIEVLGCLGHTEIVIEMTNANRPISLRPSSASPDEFNHVIMPVNRGK